MDWPTILTRLAATRPIFHSEADFQHTLAWKLHELHRDAQVRLEFRPAIAGRPHLDIWIHTPAGNVAIEVKYRSRAVECEMNGEAFALNSHAAQDQGRYDFLKDVVRLERVQQAIPGTSGAAILLTNDSALWKVSAKIDPADAAFRLDNGRTVSGELAWGPTAGQMTKRGREQALNLTGKYVLTWRDYSSIPTPAYNRFRYLLLMV